MAKHSKEAIPKARKPERMTEGDLADLCMREFEDAQILTTEVQQDRIDGLNAYEQEPYGNEEDGLSKFVASDVADAIEWIKPQIVDIFVGGDTPIMFEPENAKDVEDADTESRYCQYVFERQNNGIILAIQWFHDALVQKNGMVKCWRQKTVKREREEYQGKTSQDWLALHTDDEFEITECTVTIAGVEYSEEEYAAILDALPSQREGIDAEAEYSIIGYRKKTVSETKIEAVPPENFFISKNHNSIFIKDAPYCGEFYEKTRSELLEMGYPYDLVMALPKSNGATVTMSNEGQTRLRHEGGATLNQIDTSVDKSREKVLIYDHYIRSDFNHDGYAELRHVRTAGRSAKYVLENEEVDRNIYHALTPYLRSFRFYGKSVAERLMDLQRAKTQLWRNGFDNIAYSSIPRKIVKGNVDIAALMTYVQGGIIKCDPNGSVESEVTPFVADSALAMADKVDNIRAERTGFSKEAMGLDPSALANATTPVGMSILAQSQLLVKMIATIFAHSGFRTLMEHVRELVLKYEDGEKVFELTGKTMTTDMRRWRKQRSSSVKVGLGFAGKQEEIAVITNLLELQEKFILAQGGQIDGPLTNAKGIFNTTQRLCRRMGIKDAETYFTNPDNYKPPAPQPTIAEKTLQAQINNMANQQQIQEAKMTTDTVQQKNDHELAKAKLEQEERLAVQKMANDKEIAMMELQYKYGKDARDRHEKPATELVIHEGNRNAKDLGTEAKSLKKAHENIAKLAGTIKDSVDGVKETQKKHAEELKTIHGNVKSTVDGLATAHKQAAQEVLKAVNRKKKVKVTRGLDGKMNQIEEE